MFFHQEATADYDLLLKTDNVNNFDPYHDMFTVSGYIKAKDTSGLGPQFCLSEKKCPQKGTWCTLIYVAWLLFSDAHFVYWRANQILEFILNHMKNVMVSLIGK